MESATYLFQITGLTVIEILRFAQNDVSKLVILKERQRLKNLDDLNRFPFTQKVEIVTSATGCLDKLNGCRYNIIVAVLGGSIALFLGRYFTFFARNC